MSIFSSNFSNIIGKDFLIPISRFHVILESHFIIYIIIYICHYHYIYIYGSIYFWTLFYLSACQTHSSFSFKVKSLNQVGISAAIVFFSFNIAFYYFRSFPFPYKFQNLLVKLYHEIHWLYKSISGQWDLINIIFQSRNMDLSLHAFKPSLFPLAMFCHFQ